MAYSTEGIVAMLQKKDGNMKVYSAYKPMILDNDSETPSSAPLEKNSAPGRPEKPKVSANGSYNQVINTKIVLSERIGRTLNKNPK